MHKSQPEFTTKTLNYYDKEKLIKKETIKIEDFEMELKELKKEYPFLILPGDKRYTAKGVNEIIPFEKGAYPK